ncbi:MAG TPA: autotransporter domain-containing protein [Rhizomicrobium sp.]
MYKRALMLTAATIALLAGPAYAADNNKPQTTDANGPIDIGSNQTLTIPSSSTPATVPAIEINSANATKNIVTIETSGGLTFTDTAAAVGIQADPGKTGEVILGGSIDLSGKGTGKTGILIGSTNATITGTFTGVVDGTNNTITTDKTGVILLGGSLLKVQGDGSDGIHLATGVTLNGDIISNGTVEAMPTTANSTTTAGAVTGIELDGTLSGNLVIGSGGIVEGFGQSSRGIVVLGNISKSIQNFGEIETSGTQSTPTSDKGNPVAGSALVVSGNVSGGIYNAGPLSTSDTTGTAFISTNGNQPAMLVTTGFSGTTTATAVTIGGFADLGTAGTYSFINRGTVSSSPQNINGASTGVEIIGASGASVTLTQGLFNSGTISAATTADSNASTTNPPVASGVIIGNFANLGAGTNGYAFTNSNNGAAAGATTGIGTISATFSGQTTPGVATALAISANASVPSLLNQGSITATAVVTDTKTSSVTAIGILDQSGTLLNLNNAGTISASSSAIVNGAALPLDNRANLAQAINLANAGGAITLTNTGIITGDVLLGSFGDTVTTSGTQGSPSVINGNMNFGGGDDTLTIGQHSTVAGDVLESAGGHINIDIKSSGKLGVTNNGSTSGGRAIPSGTTANLSVSQLHVEDGGTLGLTLADGFNINRTGNAGPIVQATPSGKIMLDAGSILQINFGGFVSAPELSNGAAGAAKFVVFDASANNISIANPAQVQQALTDGIPFLFTGSACAYGVAGFTSCGAATGNPEGSTHSDVILTLQPKTAKDIGLTGYAAKMFTAANLALANDAALGAAVINAGAPLDNVALTNAQGQKLYQQIYSAFAPDVTGSARAVAISITDQASSIVGDRQRKLRMYAGQDGDATLWAQEFGQRLSVPNRTDAAGYNNSGFGVALGMDGGSISSGRFGGAFTFYAGDTSEKNPRTSKTNSQWYMLTGYQDWRGKHLFFDSNVNIAYGHLTGKRVLSIDDLSGATLITRTAEGKRSSEMASGGFSTGFIFNTGGTVFVPQFSMDALTLREEGYTESGGGAGMDLHVQPYYANSVRAFLGADLRQDLKMGDYFLQPELRAGYRYDLLSGQEKLKINFAGDQQVTPVVGPGSQFTITGPDPAKGNLVLGAGLAVTTDAWSVGVNYDYLRGFGGTKGTSQDAMLTLIGRI